MISRYNKFKEDLLLESLINESLLYYSPNVRKVINKITKDNSIGDIAKDLISSEKTDVKPTNGSKLGDESKDKDGNVSSSQKYSFELGTISVQDLSRTSPASKSDFIKFNNFQRWIFGMIDGTTYGEYLDDLISPSKNEEYPAKYAKIFGACGKDVNCFPRSLVLDENDLPSDFISSIKCYCEANSISNKAINVIAKTIIANVIAKETMVIYFSSQETRFDKKSPTK